MALVNIKGLHKSFNEVKVFDDFSLEIEKGSFTIINGASGCGKSTLLNIIGLLDSPDAGTVELFGEKNIKPFSKKSEKMLRNKLGYLFQNFALIDEESVSYNLMLAIETEKSSNKKEKISEVLKKVGLSGYGDKKIYKCSGGEQQRIAIARLLLKPCELILADEPTGSLDYENKLMIIQLLEDLRKLGKTIIVVTHDKELMNIGDKRIVLEKIHN